MTTSAAAGPAARKERAYIPKHRSAAFALLVALRALPQGSGSKQTLLEAAQPLCDASMTKPKPGTFATGWSAMATLVRKELVLRTANRLDSERGIMVEKGEYTYVCGVNLMMIIISRLVFCSPLVRKVHVDRQGGRACAEAGQGQRHGGRRQW